MLALAIQSPQHHIGRAIRDTGPTEFLVKFGKDTLLLFSGRAFKQGIGSIDHVVYRALFEKEFRND